MVERELYDQVGGLRRSYVQGGYEDSDLCLRLIEAGRRNWYLADVELYHLEAQSFPIDVRLAESVQRLAADPPLERPHRADDARAARRAPTPAWSRSADHGLALYEVTEIALRPERLERLLGFEIDVPAAGDAAQRARPARDRLGGGPRIAGDRAGGHCKATR